MRIGKSIGDMQVTSQGEDTFDPSKLVKGPIAMGKTFATGLNLGAGQGFARFAGKQGLAKSLGQVGSTMGIGATLGASAGALIGAASGGDIDPGISAAVGGAVGATALPLSGLAIGAAGNLAVGTAKAGYAAMPYIGQGIGAASPFIAATGIKVAADAGNALWSIGKSMIDWNEGADTMFEKLKLTNPISGAKAGWASGKTLGGQIAGGVKGALVNATTVLGSAAAVSGIRKAWQTADRSRMGQMTGITRATPQVPSYSNNAGATGDLVFALNQNRRG